MSITVRIASLPDFEFLSFVSTYISQFFFNSVHFKIHVPEIINHKIHTKTVFIHVHKPGVSMSKKKPKEEAPKKKTYHKESHHEDWSSWNTYGGYSNDHGEDSSSKEGHYRDHKNDDVANKEVAPKNNNPPISQFYRDSYMPVPHHNGEPDYLKGKHGDMIGYSYPPQYEVRENIRETDQNDIEPYAHMYEEGYHRGGESASGHTYSNDVTKFYDGKHEEGGHSADEEYKNESREKTHAGRYFVDDSEYQHNNKYEAEKRLSKNTS